MNEREIWLLQRWVAAILVYLSLSVGVSLFSDLAMKPETLYNQRFYKMKGMTEKVI